ncbi:hypothetical protein BJY59DRAFT_706588, partial [Rhodotorula toruloides]
MALAFFPHSSSSPPPNRTTADAPARVSSSEPSEYAARLPTASRSRTSRPCDLTNASFDTSTTSRQRGGLDQGARG